MVKVKLRMFMFPPEVMRYDRSYPPWLTHQHCTVERRSDGVLDRNSGANVEMTSGAAQAPRPVSMPVVASASLPDNQLQR